MNRFPDEKGIAMWTVCKSAEELREQLELRAVESVREGSRQIVHLEGFTAMKDELIAKRREKDEAVREKDEAVREKDAELRAEVERRMEIERELAERNKCCAIL